MDSLETLQLDIQCHCMTPSLASQTPTSFLSASGGTDANSEGNMHCQNKDRSVKHFVRELLKCAGHGANYRPRGETEVVAQRVITCDNFPHLTDKDRSNQA
jgi:hypothetical protein